MSIIKSIKNLYIVYNIGKKTQNIKVEKNSKKNFKKFQKKC